MLGGLAVWAAHFAGVYAIASVADVVQDAAAPAARGLIAAFTAACAAAAAGFALAGLRLRRSAGEDSLRRFAGLIAGAGGALAVVAVIWQGLPALMGR